MRITSNDIAILLFSRTASAEAKAKNFFLVKSLKHDRRVVQHLITQAVRAVRESMLPYFLVTEKEQRGSSFGERLCNAVEYVFSKGFGQVIIIGNDSPSLSSNDIAIAASQMQASSLVFSPTSKGGVSLIGISKAIFDKERFRNIGWQTGKVVPELIDFANAGRVRFTMLAAKDDINNYGDIKKILFLKNARSAFHFLLISLLASLSVCFSTITNCSCYKRERQLFGLRAPPFC